MKQEMLDYIKNRSFIYISKDINSKKLNMICSQGHEVSISWSNFKHRNTGCVKCTKNKQALLQKTPYEDMVRHAENCKLEILTLKDEYYKNHSKKQKIVVKCCLCGSVKDKHPWSLIKEYGCVKCKDKRLVNKRTYANDYVKAEVEKMGYVLLSPYINSKTEMKLECMSHGMFHIRWNDLNDGHRCYKCSSGSSKCEKDIYEFVHNVYPDSKKNDRTIIKPLELDIVIESKKIAIEYCGLYWHSESLKNKKYHLEKMIKTNNAGISLLTIFEDEWLNKKPQIQQLIKAKLGLNPKLNARDCEVKVLTKEETNDYLNKYHIQGTTRFLISYGLIHKTYGLVAVMTGGDHHRSKTKSLVLSRFCQGEYQVRGAASKLLKQLKMFASNNTYAKILSWSDNRWSDGQLYKALGFVLDEELEPDYSYFKGQQRFSKQSCTKKALLKKEAMGSTEKEMAESLGYGRIWDCGKRRWIMDI